MAMQRMAHSDGELAMARACDDTRTTMVSPSHACPVILLLQLLSVLHLPRCTDLCELILLRGRVCGHIPVEDYKLHVWHVIKGKSDVQAGRPRRLGSASTCVTPIDAFHILTAIDLTLIPRSSTHK